MGTGKTFEAAMWGSLIYTSAHLGINPRTLPGDHITEIAAGLTANNIDTSQGRLAGTRPILVATMSSIASQFSSEIESFLNLRSVVVSTDTINELAQSCNVKFSKQAAGLGQLKNVDERLVVCFDEKICQTAAFVVVTYDCIARHPWIVSSLAWSGVICDEAHELKGSNTHKTRALFGQGIDMQPLKHGQHTTPVLAMSGTFPKNRPGDWFVWARLCDADTGVYTSGSLSDAQRRFDRRFDGLTYKEMWLRRGGGPARKVTIPHKGAPENGDELKAILAPFIIRRLKDEIDDLPTMRLMIKRMASGGLYLDMLSHIRGAGTLSPDSQELLRRSGVMGQNGSVIDESPEDQAQAPQNLTAASLAGRLSMMSSLDKASTIKNTLDSLGWTGEKGDGKPFCIIVFHRSAMREVSHQLTAMGISHFTMSQDDSIEDRERKKTAFQAGERQAFVTTYGVGGTGLNLTRAARLLLAGLPWTDSAMTQARDRIYRIGQKNPCTIVVLLLTASIDESTYFLIKNKGRANFKTTTVDRMRGKSSALPGWATGSVLDYEFKHKDEPRSVKFEYELTLQVEGPPISHTRYEKDRKRSQATSVCWLLQGCRLRGA